MSLARLLCRLVLGRRLPRTRGCLVVPGLRRPLRIHRDGWGVPHIEADADADAAYGVGFCHGQDRAFQLELLLRATRGTLAEMVGAGGLSIDRVSRRIGFREAARDQLPVLDADVRTLLDAYAAGVNAGTTLGSPRPAHEFALLMARPTPWEPADSLGVLKLMSFTLAANWDVELARWTALTEDGPEALDALDPAYPEHHPVTNPPGTSAGPALDRLSHDLALLAGKSCSIGGSNNWAVAASRTTTGRPLLANDPHLRATMPPHWYLVHVRTPNATAAGATFLGGPGVVAGHNGHAAWGLTAGFVDNTDLFREQVSPDGTSVRRGDAWVRCPVREEVIRVRRGADVVERVLVTPHGPLLEPAPEGGGEAFALRAVWLDPLPIRGLLWLHHVRSFADFRRELASWPAASQNMVYADAGGTIGWQLIGCTPRRKCGWGLVPQPGWGLAHGWEDQPVPFDAMPHSRDPECGYIATANNQPVPEGEGPFLGADWLNGYRQAAITRALAARRDWDVATTQALQMSRQALAWEDLREAVLAAPETDADTAEALALLRAWDGAATPESAAASVYELFLAGIIARLTQAKAPRSHPKALGETMNRLTGYNFFAFRRTAHLAQLLREQPAGWLPRSWPEEVALDLGAAVRRLRDTAGPDAAGWAWGRVRPLILAHPLGEQSRLLAPLFNLGPVPTGGDADTINQVSAAPLDPLGPPDNIVSLRMVIDVGAWDNSRFVLPGGQSGNPFSPHYADQFPLWQRGEGIPIPWTEEAVRRATRATLNLLPG